MSESEENISVINQINYLPNNNSSVVVQSKNNNNENDDGENNNNCDNNNEFINLQLNENLEINTDVIKIETLPNNIEKFNDENSLLILLPTTSTTLDIIKQQKDEEINIGNNITSESNNNQLIDNNNQKYEFNQLKSLNDNNNLNENKNIIINDDNDINKYNDNNHQLISSDHSKLTENIIKNCNNLSSMMEQSKEKCVLEYLNSVEQSIDIQDKLIDNNNDNIDNNDNNNLINYSESEEDDQIKPLLIDNHTNVDYHEYYKYPLTSSSSIICNDNNQNYELNKDVASITDSDLSTQYDHLDLTNLSQNSDDFKDNNNIINNDDYNDQQQLQQQQHQQQRPPLTTTPISEILSDIKEIDTLTPLEIPDDHLCIDIVEQVEYYFSNDSILKDAFLLKHVRRNKEGFVSLKLVSSFKRVRQFTKDWRVVGNAIKRKSKKIELNDLGTKIRRIEPLPSFDETMPSRTIVASDLPYQKLCIENITEIFTKYGEIALIRILRPGMTIPIDVRQFMNKYPDMQQKECALIEYLDSQSARQAKELCENCKVFDMVAPKKKTGKKSVTTITKFIENYKYNDNNYEKSRGGGGGGVNIIGPGMMMKNTNSSDIDYRLNRFRRTSSDYLAKTEQQQQQQQQQPNHNFIYQPPHMMIRRHSSTGQDNNQHYHNINNMNLINEQNMNKINNSNNNINFNHYPPRRISNCSINSNNNNDTPHNMMSRKYSSCSEGYSSCSEISRRTSSCSSSDHHHHQQQQQQQQNLSRRSSNCSEHCPCSRRLSQCSDMYRKISQCSEHSNNSRRLSNVSYHSGGGYDRSYSNPNDGIINNRRISMDSSHNNYERKISTDSLYGSNNINNNNGHYFDNPFRKYSNGFDPFRKLSNSDQYYNGRRISTDSGYDRKLSFSSDYSTSTSPRSRTNSFINTCPHNKIDTVVRTPIGPDGTKGFSSRIRKVGHVTGSVC